MQVHKSTSVCLRVQRLAVRPAETRASQTDPKTQISWRPGEEYFVWHYEESLGAIHAVNKVRCRSELALDSALAFGRKWSKENLAKTDRFAAVPESSRVPSGTRALCVYSLPVVPATIRPHYTELWDWDRDDLIVPRSAKE